MGGFGSGSWYRWDRKDTQEEYRRLDIRYMRKQGTLSPGKSGILSWSYADGTENGKIGWRVDTEYLILDYSANGEPIKEHIYLDKTPCNYGGVRHWFKCPCCYSRVAVLTMYGERFICRHCHKLPYGSQNEGRIDRYMRKTRKIRNKLGASMDLTESVWVKPKGMHWKTFERLSRQEHKANQKVVNSMAALLGMYN